MSDGSDRIVMGADGSIRVGSAVEQRFRDCAGVYQVAVNAAGLIVLRREGRRNETGAGGRVIMAGEIITRMTMLEMISVVTNSNWRGELHVMGSEGTHRVLTLDQGALKYARSNHPDDRLGEVLYRNGVLGRAQLDEVLRAVTPDRRFGQLVVDYGFLDQEQLFQQLQKQAEQIFYGALIETGGSYVFCHPEDSSPPPAHTVHIPVHALLMEGVQRIDEMALFRQRIPSSQMSPEATAAATKKSLDGMAMTVLAYCDGTRTIEDIARATGLGEFHTTKTVYHLMQAGALALRSSKQIDEGAVRRLVSTFNDVMRDIFMAVATYGGVDQTRQTLSAWMQGSGYGPYFGDGVEEDGSIDPHRVADAMRGVDHAHPVEALHQALHELVAFALFAATTTLPRDQELVLARDVNRRLKAIRI